MNELPLTSLEASHLLDAHRMRMWSDHTMDRRGLVAVLSGDAVEGVCGPRLEGVPESVALRVLDAFDAANRRPPTAVELSVALDRVLNPGMGSRVVAECKAVLADARTRAGGAA